jgi:hypothetical protein
MLTLVTSIDPRPALIKPLLASCVSSTIFGETAERGRREQMIPLTALSLSPPLGN